MRAERIIAPGLEASIGVNGVKLNDELNLDVFQEKRRSLKMNRTKYYIKSGTKFSIDYSTSTLTLPIFGREKWDFELELIEEKCYLLRAVGDLPFRLNGTYSFEAFLEKGDIVDIGFNRLAFQKQSQNSLGAPVFSDKIVRSPVSIVLEGETGTGKTTLAKKIHNESQRPGSFVHLNLAAFSSSLIESELFGHVKGAFTGALNGKKGAILEANRGTLFLDEIDSLSLDLQTKLLLFLDNHEVRAVGGENVVKADVRVIFASGRNLKQMMKEGSMRRDFYFRIMSGCSYALPSLRHETLKIKELCLDFEKKEAITIGKELIDFYGQCQWPGNIRQLNAHLVKKKYYSNGPKFIFDQMDKDLLDDEVRPLDTSELFSLEKVKEDYCYNVYLKADKNITKTAKILELSPNTLKAYLGKRLRNNNVVNVDF